MSDQNASSNGELDPVLAEAAAALRVPLPLGPAFEERVMAAVRLSERPRGTRQRGRWIRASRWATASHVVELSPLRGMAAAAGLAALLAGAVWLGRQSVALTDIAAGAPRSVAPAGSTHSVRQVEFVLAAPRASEVMLVGDFNGWSPRATPLRPSERNGVWSVTIPLAPGRHEYAFLVDGKHWLPDPQAARAPGDDFGSPNSVLTVTERS